ncbi:MAG: AAA family ATPase [Bryobacterales bacterium]|nr:AAA family ATPase [Bryobacterales bacterium]
MAASHRLPPSNTALVQDIESFRPFTMAHPRLVQAKEELLSAIEGSAPGSLILVIGPSGVGKSTLRRRVESALIEKMRAEIEADPGRIPFISIEAVAPDNGVFHWRDHYQRILAQIQEPAIDHKLGLPRGEGERTANGRYAPWPRGFTGYQLQQSIENALRHRRPAAVLIDEAQHLGRIASGRKLADQLDVIKSTASRSNTVHVLIGTYELLAFRNLSAQLSRRSVDLHFSRYRTENAEDVEVFQNAVFTFQKQLRSCEQLDLVKVWDFLYERSLGCIGILKDWLMQALIVAARNASPALNSAILEKTALSASQCEKMLQEAREGEARLADNDDNRLRLRRLLNLADQAGAPTSTVKEPVAPSKKPRGRRTPGVRHPQRDQIGLPRQAGEAAYA